MEREVDVRPLVGVASDGVDNRSQTEPMSSNGSVIGAWVCGRRGIGVQGANTREEGGRRLGTKGWEATSARGYDLRLSVSIGIRAATKEARLCPHRGEAFEL